MPSFLIWKQKPFIFVSFVDLQKPLIFVGFVHSQKPGIGLSTKGWERCRAQRRPLVWVAIRISSRTKDAVWRHLLRYEAWKCALSLFQMTGGVR